jgi:hypothetical protein
MFQCLADHNIESPTEVHLTVGDFNSHIGTEQESHFTLDEAKHVPTRQGDPHPAHQPISTLRDDSITMNAKARGRLLLRLLNSTSQLVANGRFESTQNPNFPDTLTRTRTNDVCSQHSASQDTLGNCTKCRGILSMRALSALSRTDSDEASSRSYCAQLTI